MSNTIDQVIETKPQKRSKKGIIFSIVFLAVNLLIIIYIGYNAFKGQNENIWQMSGQVFAEWFKNWPYLFLTFGMFFLAVFAEALKYFLFIYNKTGKWQLGLSLRIVILGKYYDSVTPFASGGQPFQIYELTKSGVPVGISGALPIISFFLAQLAFVILAVIVFITRPWLIEDTWWRIAAYVGAFLEIFIPLMIIGLTLMPKLTQKFLNWIIKLLGKMKIIKNREKHQSSLSKMMVDYRGSVMAFKNSKFLIFICFLLSVIYKGALFSVPFFVLKACGIHNVSWYNTFALTVFITAAVAFVPTPGNSGAAEIGFVNIFIYLTGAQLFWGMMLWRIGVYYMFIIIGFVIVLYSSFRTKKQVFIAEKKKAIDTYELLRPRMKVALFVDNYYPVVDGVIKAVDNYARILTTDGYEATVYVPRTKGYDDPNRGYNLIRTPSMRFFKFEYPIARPNKSKEARELLKPDTLIIYHVHSPFVMGHFALRKARRNNVPIVATFHSKYYDDFYQVTKSKFISRLLIKYIIRFYNKCDAVWTVNEGTERTLREYGYKGDVKIMSNGTHFKRLPEAYVEERSAGRATYGIAEDEKVLIFVGHLIWQKNIKTILETMKLLESESTKYRIFIAGEGGNEKDILLYAQKKHFKEKTVTFIGAIKDEEKLRQVYAMGDLFFFPSVYDNQPLVVREAAMLFCPALLINGSNAACGIEDKRNGFLTENTPSAIKQKIVEVFADEDLRRKVGQNAHESLPTQWNEILKTTEQEYIRIIKDFYEKKSKE